MVKTAAYVRGGELSATSLPKDASERILSRTRRRGKCRLWVGCLNSAGAPVIDLAGCKRLCRRAMYAVVHGCCPAGVSITTSCERALCLEPTHLRSYVEGEHSHGPLSDRTVRAIRKLWPTHSVAQLAAKFGVSDRTIENIVHGRTYPDSSYAGLWKMAGSPGGYIERVTSRLTPARVQLCRRQHRKGATVISLAAREGVAYSTMHAAVHGKTFQYIPGATTQCCAPGGRTGKRKTT